MHVATLPQSDPDPEPARDDFDAPNLRFCWNFLRNPNSDVWSLTERPGWLRFRGSTLNLDAQDSPTFIGRRQQHFSCRIRALLTFSPQREGHEAGLTVLANNHHHYEIALTSLQGQRSILVRRRIGDLIGIVVQEPIAAGPIELEIRANTSIYTFSYALAGQSMRDLATASTRYLSTEVAGGFTGVYIGMYATSNGDLDSTGPADFDWFEYHTGS